MQVTSLHDLTQINRNLELLNMYKGRIERYQKLTGGQFYYNGPAATQIEEKEAQLIKETLVRAFLQDYIEITHWFVANAIVLDTSYTTFEVETKAWLE